MKKLLFLISAFLIAFQIGSCGNRRDSKPAVEPIVENQTQNIGVVNDTAKAVSSAQVNDTTSGKQLPKEVKVIEAPIHNAPDQQKIDSIKAAKAKKKN